LSGYFNRALSGRWEENNSGHIELEDDPRIFGIFLRYAHEGHLSAEVFHPVITSYTKRPYTAVWPVRLLGEDAYDALKEKEHDASDTSKGIINIQTHFSFSTTVDLYIFADFRAIPRLEALAETLLVNKILLNTLHLPIPILHTLLDETAAGKDSNLFLLLVNISACYVSDSYFEQYSDEIPVEFVVAVLKRARELGVENEKKINRACEESEYKREIEWVRG
jgi:hypothetical protein